MEAKSEVNVLHIMATVAVLHRETAQHKRVAPEVMCQANRCGRSEANRVYIEASKSTSESKVSALRSGNNSDKEKQCGANLLRSLLARGRKALQQK